MIDLNFEDYSYYPTLRTRAAELKGLEQLDGPRKERIVPLLTMGRWPRAADFGRSADKVAELMGTRPYFLDLTTDATHLADHHQQLQAPENSFEAWRTFTSGYGYAIPVVQMPATARRRDIARQALEIERSVGKVAFRIRDFGVDTPIVISAMSALDDLRDAIVFVDCQYIRDALAAFVTASVATINQLRAEYPEVFIALLSTSFPASTPRYADSSQQRGSIDILERVLHARVGGTTVAAYGDHGSIHSVVYDDAQILRWAARVDYPHELDWYFERRPGSQTAQGYIDAARAVLASEPDMGDRGIWGEEMIRQAAAGQPHARAPGPWISVRVNIHLARQIDFSGHLTDGPEDEEDIGDDDV